MKRYLLLFAASAAVLSFSSCQKDYTCQCVTGLGQKDLIQIHDTKSHAKKTCESWNVGTPGFAYSDSCKLK